MPLPPQSLSSGRGFVEEAAGPQKVRWTRGGAGVPWLPRSLEQVLLTAQQLHVLSDSVVPGYIWAGCAQSKTRRHLKCSCGNYYPNCLEDLVIYSPLVPVLSPVHAVITVGHLVGCHTLDVAKVSGPLHDDVCHSLLGAQHSKAEFLSAVQALNSHCLFSHA